MLKDSYFALEQWPRASLGVSLLVYMGLVWFLRWKRYKRIHQKYQSKFEAGTLTPEEAQRVIAVSSQYDMPMLLTYSLSFALFKTYGIPTISKILASTQELSSREWVSKRYADTEILICELGTIVIVLSSLKALPLATWVTCPITGKVHVNDTKSPPLSEKLSDAATKSADPRAMIALARVNWLHAKYPIKNNDHLYTLALFAFEPERWAKQYGWRALSPLECQAYYLFWAEIGKRMNIKDIPESADAFKAWFKGYEERVMVSAQTNHDVAQYTLDELLYAVPTRFGLREFARSLAISLLEDITREAMMYPVQPAYKKQLVNVILHSINFFQRFFCLPRRSPQSVVQVSLPDFQANQTKRKETASSAEGINNAEAYRMHPQWYQPQPWYKPVSGNILGKMKDRLAITLGLAAQLPSPELRSNGYRLEEMGPMKYETVGNDEVMKMAEELLQCPIRGPWARG
ncbi:hypothetical protein K435DRAFT_785447 [Dendrothele bispora CBS 962.96]|uniref:ER-bound oxygenase mpaB/mpaB'/Rubber oxygenase catalytic domain-containing protein n=1 Tax=Dendrothele bispora (strain CBS 962.96) TaxID=1314807 RepID=A0A4S8KWU9_DENBC|nr:hypothetical protein K435DRAFT_785447 [Dendrothele bispora CBS 962.96]